MPTLLLEVYIVLGKALINGRLTVEGYDRLVEGMRATRIRRRADVTPVVIFTGWAGDPPALRPEGRVLLENFESLTHHRGVRWPGELICEEQARSSVENVRNAMAKQRHKFPNAIVVRYHYVSSDYHVERTWEVDEFLPELTDLEELRRDGREVLPVRAPYFYATCGDPEREWCAEGYLQMHKLTLLQVNLLGLGGNLHISKEKVPKIVKPGTISELRREPFETLPATIRVLDSLLYRLPPKGPLWKRKIEPALKMIGYSLEVLRELENTLEQKMRNPSPTTTDDWIGFQKKLNEAMYPLRTEYLDPDEVF